MLNYYYKESSYRFKSCVILQLKLINKLSLSVCLFILALYPANQESIFAMMSYTSEDCPKPETRDGKWWLRNLISLLSN